MNQKLSGAMLLGGGALFLYRLGELFQKHSDWTDFRTPAGVGEIVMLLAGVLVAIVGALGLDFSSLLSATTRKTLAWILVGVTAAGAATAITGCASVVGKPATAPVVDTASLVKVANRAEDVGILLRGFQQGEIIFFQAGRIAPAAHRAFQTNIKTFADAALLALEAMKDVTQSDATRRSLVEAALKLGDGLLNGGILPIEDPNVKAELRASLAGIRALLAIML